MVHPLKDSVIMITSLYRQRALLAVLVSRDLKARYRGTFLGYLWSLLNPLLLLAVYSLVFTFVIPARVEVTSFPLFLFAGLLPWLFFSNALLEAAIVIAENGPLLKKVVCPPEVFPAVKTLSHLVHHLLALPVLVVAIIVSSIMSPMPFPWTIFLLPLAIALWVITISGLVLAVAALAVHFRDLRDLLQNLLNLLFFVTPIIYNLQSVPERLRPFISLNPITPLIEVYRDLALLGRFPPASAWAGATLTALICWWLGTFIFSRLRESLAEAV